MLVNDINLWDSMGRRWPYLGWLARPPFSLLQIAAAQSERSTEKEREERAPASL